MRWSITILLFLQLGFSGWAQIDSIIDPYVLINEANKLIETDNVLALSKTQQALGLAYKQGNKRAEGYCYNLFGTIDYTLDKYPTAIAQFRKALGLFKEINDDKGVYTMNKYLGSALEANLQLDEAAKVYEEFLQLAEEAGNQEDIDATKIALGRVYFNQGKYEEARDNFESQRQQAEKDPVSNEDELVEIYNNLGKVYDVMNDSASAFQNYNKSLEIGQKNGNDVAIQGYYDNVYNYWGSRGNVQEQINVGSSAVEYYNQQKKGYKVRRKKRNEELTNIQYSKSAANGVVQQQASNMPSVNTIQPDFNSLNSSNLELGKLYLTQNNPGEAIPYINNSINLSQDLGELENQAEGYEALIEAYEQSGDFDKAVDAYKMFIRIKDSLEMVKTEENRLAMAFEADIFERDKRIALMQEEIEIEQKRFDLMLQEKEDEARFSRLLMYVFLGGIGLLGIAFLFFSRGAKEKRKAHQLLMLKSLRTQMNPHFIFNSLNSVNSFISQSDERSANKYLSEFSRLMRMVLENSKHDFVSLSSELQTLELYLSLEHLRFQTKFDYTFDVEATGTDEILVPPMLIQPYIENAVWHGLRYKEEKGFLHVSCTESEDELKWVIEDNGIGRAKSRELKTRHQKEGKSTGMKNINERIRIFREVYGHEMSLNVSDLDQEGTGTRVELIIPKKSEV